jgi:hypothetical protein
MSFFLRMLHKKSITCSNYHILNYLIFYRSNIQNLSKHDTTKYKVQNLRCSEVSHQKAHTQTGSKN